MNTKELHDAGEVKVWKTLLQERDELIGEKYAIEVKIQDTYNFLQANGLRNGLNEEQTPAWREHHARMDELVWRLKWIRKRLTELQNELKPLSNRWLFTTDLLEYRQTHKTFPAMLMR